MSEKMRLQPNRWTEGAAAKMAKLNCTLSLNVAACIWSRHHNDQVNMPKDQSRSNLELVKEAQKEVRDTITEARFGIIATMKELKSIGGEEVTEESLLALLLKYPTGIEYPFLQTVFQEAALIKAREALKKQGKIEQTGKKGNVVLKPNTAKKPKPETEGEHE